ncbi:MAG: 2-iminoacetate synthase ThiH, partial [Kiritimatiellia bacterium]|nr:2-iminoacetate synthase ThiH [Kiritimatiellia bacterium]
MKNTLPDWLAPETWVAISRRANARDVLNALASESPGLNSLAALLSPAAFPFLEPMAHKALHLTRRHFGRTITLYVPLYLSNYCSGGCAYCGFAADRHHPRRRLERDMIGAEMEALRKMGFEEILLLTGERTPQADFHYLRDAVALAAERFSLVTIESFPMTTEEYKELVDTGCAGMTIYQETYNPGIYAKMHRWGPKRNFSNRLETPARALTAGMRFAGLGALLGLADPVAEAICLFRHIEYLRREYWQVGFSISFPRVRSQSGGFSPANPVGDSFLAQMIFAFRICLPDVHLVLSTRENPKFRDGIAGIGISKMSVASKTTVGGYHADYHLDSGQFDVADPRGVDSFCKALKAKGLQPVFKNW